MFLRFARLEVMAISSGVKMKRNLASRHLNLLWGEFSAVFEWADPKR